MAGYRDLLRIPGVGRMLSAQLVARFPNGMISLVILLHIEGITGSYGAAGLVLAAVSIGQAIAGPVTSRWMGRWGMRRVLTLTTAVSATSLLAIALLTSPLPVYIVLGFIAGMSTPPIVSAVRTIYPKLVNSTQLTALYSLDASLQELIWILAPVLITFVAIQAGTVTGLVLIVVILVCGCTWFILSPQVGRVRIPRSKRAFGTVLTRPPILLATVIGFLLVGSFAAVEASVVATFSHGGIEAGLVLAVFSLGSLAGGLAFGHLPMGPWALARRLAVVAFGLALTSLWINMWWIGATLVVAGIGIAPALAVLSAVTTASVKFSDTAEAFGWVGTGQLIGAAVGSAVAGFLIDGPGGVAASYGAAAGFCALALVVAVVFVRGLPDLRVRGASPIPDTEPVQTIG
ncbi:MFS transporter [Microbacterium allomyrinae]|uniref:MFS transporter n=1 Tax=Microbacterium allomyrinae TaxID=2830666 RepID=A0A9X1LS21_9MICO|nr:MFS transporter [Microbacterium allomyrinae]MCC2030826.1 MFS transporter [Microbacterium allomyrinae]